MRPCITLMLLSLAAGPGVPALLAQADSTPASKPARPEQIVDHTFTIANGERLRVFLTGGTTYRAEIEGGGIRLQVRPVDPGTQAPRVQPLLPGRGAGGSAILTILPFADAEYEIRSTGGDPARPVQLRLTRQPPH